MHARRIGPCALLLAIIGCQSPLQREQADDLHRHLIASVQRELDSLPRGSVLETSQPPSAIDERIARNREELEAMAGPGSYADTIASLSRDLTAGEQRMVPLSLRAAVESAVGQNLAIEIARIQPAIARSGVVRAEAAFDAVFFASATHTRTDEPSIVPILGGIPLGAAVRVRDDTSVEAGVRQPLTSGGELEVSTRLERGDNRTPGFASFPDPSYLTRIIFGINQPLLRGFGEDTNLAQVRIAENADRRALQEFRTALLRLVLDVEQAYWDLVAARHTLMIRTRLLDRGEETRGLMERRAEAGRTLDSQLADVIATVERRRADLIRAERAVRAASDRLKTLINAPDATLASEVLLEPVDFMVEAPLQYELREIIITALEQRPEIQTALLDLDDTAINLQVADNARLPLLNLTAQMQLVGLSDGAGGAYESSIDDTFIDYVIGLVFEQPIGNRAAEAGFREARLRQSAAAIAYRQAVQNVVLDVKDALRDVVANYELIQASRIARLAAAENLRATLIDEENRRVASPEFLNLKLQRQELLAAAEALEIEALSNYNQAVARLYRAMGVGLEMNEIEMRVGAREVGFEDAPQEADEDAEGE